MSTTYRLRGRRHLRMYTAPSLTPSTAAGSDVAAISDRLREVPWTEAPLDAYPSFPTYAAAKVDENASARACFDAAEWCAEHDAAKRHRAYAQAAIYRFALPEAARAVTLESVAVTVTCDPYTPQGARVAAMLTDADDLPTECALVRTMDAHAEGVAPRTAVTNAGTGAVTWYETTATADLAIGSAGRKWLLVFVGLEDYRARNGWLEGAAMIGGVSATFSAPVPGWSETAPVDLRFDGAATVALEGGSSPTWLQPLNMIASTGLKAGPSFSRQTFLKLVEPDVWGVLIEHVVTWDPDSGACAISGKFLYTKNGNNGTLPINTNPYQELIVSKVKLTGEARLSALTIPAATSVFIVSAVYNPPEYSYTLRWSSLQFAAVVDGRVVLSVFGFDANSGEYKEAYYSPIDMGAVPVDVGPYWRDPSGAVRTGTSSDEALGDMSWQVATRDAATGARTPEDSFAHLVELMREVGAGVANDYAFAASAFPNSDLDRVTVVPRFCRAEAVPSGQTGISQPGLSLWYRKSEDGISFLQGGFLAVRSPCAGRAIRLTALGAVANTGLVVRLAVWRSSGVAWEGTAGYHTAQQLVKAVGFVDASEASVTAPTHKFADGDFAGLPTVGGVTASRIGMSSEISTALAEGDRIDIRLDSAVTAGDVLIIAPVPVGLSPAASGGDAHFGRQSDPSAETTKSWCRYTANLGWYPKIEIM